ncbi:DUF551 domain-containing protein [Cronobacter malonaticus]
MSNEKIQWLHDAATEFASTGMKMTMNPDEVLQLTTPLLALRKEREAAVPVYQCMDDGKWYDTEKRLYDEVKENGNECRVLYAAPPAQPVAVPDGEQLRALFDAWFESDCSFDRSPDATEEDNIAWRESYWYVWKRCRAAMLAAPGKPVAAGWIACSERMPDEGVSVLAFCKCGDKFSGIYTMRAPVIRSKNSRKGDAIAHHERVTHWMPLPAAPGREG